MLKRLILSLAFAGLISPAFAAGTLPGISMSQQFDTLGKPLNGGKLYLIQAGTTSTLQNCYQDSGLTLALPNPITLDSAGRIPQLFCADGSIKIRLTNSVGVTQLVADNLLVVGPSGGGGGGGTVDPTTVLATGDMKLVYNTGVYSGFVRANGKTIGSATSGATERANADCQSLFIFLWGADSNLSVSGGRGASAAADWAANKTIALPDFRGRVPGGLDDMGNSAAGRLTASYFGSSATTLGVANGVENTTLVTTNLPPYTPAGSVALSSWSLGVPVRNYATSGSSDNTKLSLGSNIGTDAGALNMSQGTPANSSLSLTQTFTGTAQGGTSTPIRTVQPTMLVTIYIKL